MIITINLSESRTPIKSAFAGTAKLVLCRVSAEKLELDNFAWYRFSITADFKLSLYLAHNDNMNTHIAKDSVFTVSGFACVLFGYTTFQLYNGMSEIRSGHLKPFQVKWPTGVLTNGMNCKKIASDWIKKQEAA